MTGIRYLLTTLSLLCMAPAHFVSTCEGAPYWSGVLIECYSHEVYEFWPEACGRVDGIGTGPSWTDNGVALWNK